MYQRMATSELAVDVLSISAAHELVKKEADGSGVMVIFGSLTDALSYYKLGRKMGRINVGCLRHEPGKKRISDSVFLSEEDIRVLREFVILGVEVVAQGIPGDKQRNLLAVVNEL